MRPSPDLTATPVTDLLDLGGRTAVVTGAARGIGRACALRLAEAGARVVGADLVYGDGTEEGIDGIAARHVDVTDPDSVGAVVDRVVQETGRLDIWVNAAGIFPRGGVLELGLEDWRTVFAINVEGSFLGAQLAGRHMTEAGGGVIVNVASTVAHRVNGNAAHYRASKASLLSLTQNLAVELGPAGVRALAVCPTLTLTEGVQNLAGTDPVGLERFGARLPLGRAAVPDDVARAVLFAVSPMAGYMTGSALYVDGGELHR
ncbi:SDR family oxidoreductase [Pseudonocardia ailaonensis]|uniref:SDR family oxidoreductase n=1 Tax=Pseudonocardia ailaonensis TaxID=367279 RepID=A0ABN2N5K4_9PSEU